MPEGVTNVFAVKLLKKELSKKVLKKCLKREALYRATDDTESKREGKTRSYQVFIFLKK